MKDDDLGETREDGTHRDEQVDGVAGESGHA
jgi:hypothetical protein